MSSQEAHMGEFLQSIALCPIDGHRQQATEQSVPVHLNFECT